MPEVRVMEMSAQHRLIIERFAEADARTDWDYKALRERALGVYYHYKNTTPGDTWNRHMKFMEAVDNASPAFAACRARLLARENLP